MLRRFEIYAVPPEVPAERVEAMAAAMRDCSRYIPEVLHSAIGHARSNTTLNFVWEHAYASAESYRRYMAHPYHAAILDRYLLNDSPERIIASNDYGLGLVGYSCETADFVLPAGAARRLLALQLKPGACEAFAAFARGEAESAGMAVSVVAANTFASRWFDGESLIMPEPELDTLWEQGFASLDEALAYQPQYPTTLIKRSLELVYRVEA